MDKWTIIVVFSILLHLNAVTAIPAAAIKFIGSAIANLLSRQAKDVVQKIRENIKENIGKDISIGDLATMNVEMVTVVEPIENSSVIVEYLGAKARTDHLLMNNIMSAGSGIFRKSKMSLSEANQAQIVLNELAGIYIVMNESDTALAEVLLSAPLCVLTREDKFFSDMRNPCTDIGREAFTKIIKRYEDISSMQDILAESVKTPGEWHWHWRQIVLRLDPYRQVLTPEQTSKFPSSQTRDTPTESKMVILGFRPRATAPETKATPTKTRTDAKKNENNSIANIVNDGSDITKVHTPPVNPPTKSHIKVNFKPKPHTANSYKPNKQQQPVSSNWKRLKSLKAFTTAEMKECVKTVSDADWFGVKDVEEFATGREDQILRENVSTATLFPPPPAGMSEEKLKQPCKFVALDCEMVGTGLRGFESILARVSVVNFHGIELMDVYVRPTRRIVDYRTAVSGVTPGHLTPSKDDSSMNIFGQPLLTLTELQNRLVPLLHERIVVGHALNNDFAALLLSSNHPRRLIRDTSRYSPFRALVNGRSPSLKMLAARILGVRIQSASHDSVDDARIAMLLYRSVKGIWENSIFTGTDKKNKKKKKKEDLKENKMMKNVKRRKRNHPNDSESESEANSDNIFNSIL